MITSSGKVFYLHPFFALLLLPVKINPRPKCERVKGPKLGFISPIESDHLLLLVLVVVHLGVLGQLSVRAGSGRSLLAPRTGDSIGGVLDVLASLGVAANPANEYWDAFSFAIEKVKLKILI